VVSALGLTAVVCGLTLLAASVVAATAAADGRLERRRLARFIALAAAAPLLLLLSRPGAQSFVGFAVAAALAGPQPLALALAASAAVLAGVIPTAGVASVAQLLAGVTGALAAHAVGRSVWSHLAAEREPAGRDAAWTASAAGAGACGLVLAVGGPGVLRWDYVALPGGASAHAWDAGLVLALTLLSSLAGALLLGADALAATETSSVSPLARMLGRRALLLAAGLAFIAAFLVAAVAGWIDGLLRPQAMDVAGLVAAVGLIGCAVPALLAERVCGDAFEEQQEATVLSRLVVVLALAAMFAGGIEGWLRAGTYLTPLTQRLLSAALVGFAASETTRLRTLARVLTLGAVGWALVR